MHHALRHLHLADFMQAGAKSHLLAPSRRERDNMVNNDSIQLTMSYVALCQSDRKPWPHHRFWLGQQRGH